MKENINFWVTWAALDHLLMDLKNPGTKYPGDVVIVTATWIPSSSHPRSGEIVSLKQRAFDFVSQVVSQNNTTSKAASSVPVEDTRKWQA